MIVALNGWCDLAHINEGIKKSRHHAGPKNINKTKRLITEA